MSGPSTLLLPDLPVSSNDDEKYAQISVARRRVSLYLKSLFPFLAWIGHYNSTWLASDLIAGITVGAIVVPQGMAYASLAKLDPEFGLYSSFVGVMIYWLFGTSKDISIGPVAVLSTVVGNLINQVSASDPDAAPFVIAATLSISTGIVVLLMGLLRCGWIVNLVSAPALAAFMTGSAITITTSQVPSILGLTGFSNRRSSYEVFTNIIIHAGEADVNAVLGISALLILYGLRYAFTTAADRSVEHKQTLLLLNSMRAVAVIVVYTLISWLVHRYAAAAPGFDVLGTIPRGFQHFGMPPVNASLLTTILPYVPATIVVMLVEHTAIGKSFGRANDYTIDASQEMIAIGVTNLVGPFFGGFASTGSFSRTAIQSKAGSRTPMAGVVTGLVVLLAVHLLTAAFYYIPSAVLSAVVVHAVGDLVTPVTTLRQYWAVSPVELLVFLVGVVTSVVKSIETGLYASVALSTAALFYKSIRSGLAESSNPTSGLTVGSDKRRYGTFEDRKNPVEVREYATESCLVTRTSSPTSPGVVFQSLPSSLDYVTAARFADDLIQNVQAHTKRGSEPQDQSWSTVGYRKQLGPDQLSLPSLNVVVLDFSLAKNIDVTAVQQLFDLQKQLEKYAMPDTVEWRFIRVTSYGVRSALHGASMITIGDIEQARL